MIVRILKSLILFVLFVVLIAAGGYGYLWWSVTQTTEKAAAQVAPFLGIEYGSVHIDPLKNELGLRQVMLLPVGMQDGILLERIVVRTNQPWQLFTLPGSLGEGRLPDNFNLMLRGIDLNLNSDYMQMLSVSVENAQAEVGTSYETLGCGDLDMMGVRQFQQMGYGQMLSDAQLSYRLDQLQQEVLIGFEASTEGMASVEFTLQASVSDDKPSLQSAISSGTLLQQIELRLADRGYNKRRNNFCAKLNEEPVDAYRERYRALLADRLAKDGWVVPPSLLEAYDKLNNPGGSMLLRLRPNMTMGPRAAGLLQQPSELIAALNPYLEFSGKAVPVEGVDWLPPGQRPEVTSLAQQNESETVDGTEAIADKEPVETVALVKSQKRPAGIGKPILSLPKAKTYQKVKISALANHVGEQAILRTYFGRKVEGRIISVTASEVVIEHRPADGRGTATYPIAREKIELAKVFL